MILENKVIHICCGIGAAALGMQQSLGEYKGAVGRFRTLVGIDVDPLACEDFVRLTGAPSVRMDLFSRKDYIDFHGHEPPEGWREVTPDDIFEAAGREYPNTAFISAPCKGLSGLLPKEAAESKKYQALNKLTVRSVDLTLKAFELNPIDIFLFENVPRIRTRGERLLKEIRRLFHSYGYEIAQKENEVHDCGELGGLAQHRNRFLLIARHRDKVPAFVYKPPRLPLKTIGDVIGPMPLPDDPAAGAMHKMPRLQWKTWVRLALIPAGGDWRDLQNITPEQYRIEHVPRKSALGVMEWDRPGGTVIGNMRIGGSTKAAIPDPRMNLDQNSTHRSIYRVSRDDEPAGTVTGAYRPNNGAMVIPDPRLQSCEGKHPAVYRVVKFNETGPCVTGTRFGSGAPAIADPRFTCSMYPDSYGIQKWDEPGVTIRGNMRVMASRASISDPRILEQRFSNYYQLSEWDETASTVTGRPNLHSGAQSIADPRLNCTPRSGTMGVNRWDEPGKTVIGAGDIHAGSSAVADPRIPDDTESGVYVIIAEDGTWHRPLTTLELAALQSIPLIMPDGSPLVLAGKSDARWREAIGNAVPPAAAKAMGNQILVAWLASQIGWEWELSQQQVWVRPVEGDDIDPARVFAKV